MILVLGTGVYENDAMNLQKAIDDGLFSCDGVVVIDVGSWPNARLYS